MPLISAFRRGRNDISHEFEANTELQRDMPASSRSCSCHGMSGFTARKLTRTEEQSQREIPSAATLKILRTCFASKCQPEDNSSTPRRRINAPDLGSSPPRQRRTHSTAASLSPRNNTESSMANGPSSHAETRTHAETTQPSGLRTLNDVSLSSATDLLDPPNRDRSPASNSYREYTPVSRKTPPTAVLNASENRVRLGGRSSELIHRSRQGFSARVQPFLNEPQSKLEITMELGSQGETSPGFAIRQSNSAPAAMRGIPTEANKWLTKKHPGHAAKETCMRKPTSCDTCFAGADARDEGRPTRILCILGRLWGGNETVSTSVFSDPSQHFELRVPVSKFLG